MRYPAMTFKGHIVYSRTFSEVEKAADELLRFVETKNSDGSRAAIGFDIEWRPSFKKGVAQSKAAVLQICADAARCHVMHIIHSGFPQNLKSLLADSRFIKVGVGIAGDARKVFNDHNVSVDALEDLSRLANKKLGGEPKMWGLSSLTEKLTCKQVLKPSKIRLGNWEANPLSVEQLKYAATDAFVSWHLYEVSNMCGSRQVKFKAGRIGLSCKTFLVDSF
ncbi:putative DNA helicase [Helianthus annuus]|nr:putative DNA helicase [Helianthus annuus]